MAKISKAERWSKKLEKLRDNPPTLVLDGPGRIAYVDPCGWCEFEFGMNLSPEQSLALGKWLVETFEPREEP